MAMCALLLLVHIGLTSRWALAQPSSEVSGDCIRLRHAYPNQVATFAGRMRHTLTFLSGGALPAPDGAAIDTLASRFTGASTCEAAALSTTVQAHSL